MRESLTIEHLCELPWNFFSRTPLQLWQVSPEWSLDWSLLKINQQIKYFIVFNLNFSLLTSLDTGVRVDSSSFAAFAKNLCHSQLNPPYLKRWRLVHFPHFLEHENHKIAHKNAQKSFINLKPRISKVAITGTNFAPQPPPPKKNLTLCVICRVRFERYCGKMYSRHLFRTAD